MDVSPREVEVTGFTVHYSDISMCVNIPIANIISTNFFISDAHVSLQL